MKRIAGLFILLPIGILIVALAVANRQVVSVSIPPQVGDAPLYSFSLPLFALLFVMLFVGMLIGSFATWITQGKHRKQARIQKIEATKATFEAKKQAERADAMAETMTNEQKALGALGLAPPSSADSSKAA
ncbi:MAG: LapA family protein [Hyphomicrobiales bacterium]|nr:LapA family protein [Hyphomicrobiales bacterium]